MILPLLSTLVLAPAPPTGSDAIKEAANAFFVAAESQDDEAFVRTFAKHVSAADQALLMSMYEVLGAAPFKIDYPAPAIVNGHRALATFQVSSALDLGNPTPPSWLWLEEDDTDRWVIARLDRDHRYSREWLYETPKSGLAPDAHAAAKNLFDAMQAGARRKAERACSDVAWGDATNGLAVLYQTTQDVGLRFRTQEPTEVGDRAVIAFGLDYGGEVRTDTFLMVERRGKGWIATGFDTSESHTQAFLRFEVDATRTPTSPYKCVEGLIASINGCRPVRLRKLSTSTFQSEPQVISGYANLVARGGSVSLPRGGLELNGTRGVARIQVHHGRSASSKNTLWLLELRPEGWRLVGETEVPDRADNFLVAVEPR